MVSSTPSGAHRAMHTSDSARRRAHVHADARRAGRPRRLLLPCVCASSGRYLAHPLPHARTQRASKANVPVRCTMQQSTSGIGSSNGLAQASCSCARPARGTRGRFPRPPVAARRMRSLPDGQCRCALQHAKIEIIIGVLNGLRQVGWATPPHPRGTRGRLSCPPVAPRRRRSMVF